MMAVVKRKMGKTQKEKKKRKRKKGPGKAAGKSYTQPGAFFLFLFFCPICYHATHIIRISKRS
jgi:hypothetical protein